MESLCRMDKWYVMSPKLPEQNYLTHDLELAVIIHALKMRRDYLLGRQFVLISDHIGSRYLFDQLNLNVGKARWLAMISEFDFEIRYIKGKENRVVDSLNRWVKVHFLVAMSSYGTDLQDRILWVGQQDVRYMDILHRLQQSTGTGTATGGGVGTSIGTGDGTGIGTSSGTGIGVGAQDLDYYLIVDGLVKF